MAVILLVADHAVHRSALRYFLRQRGHEVDLAVDGADALARLRDRRPDVIVLDLAMPNLDGLGVLAALRASAGPPTPVVVVTASSDADTLTLARELGAREVLVKTAFSLTQLADSVDRAAPATAPEAVSSSSSSSEPARVRIRA